MLNGGRINGGRLQNIRKVQYMTRNVHIGGNRSGRCQAVIAVAGLAGAALLAGALAQPAAHAASPPTGLAAKQGAHRDYTFTELRSPPKPPTDKPGEPSGYEAPTGLLHKGSGGALTRTAALDTPVEAKTWGVGGSATTLVLYDTTSEYGWLGELYAIAAGNLATHFGTVTAEPVVDYEEGQISDYTATIYLGSTYDEPIPTTFLNDVLTTTKPVIWVGDNIWQLSGAEGSPADSAFENTYGWDPGGSLFDSSDNVSSVSYNGQAFTRSVDNTGDLLAPDITNTSAVTTLASANCTDPTTGDATDCTGDSYLTGTSFPWAIHSGNLMYVDEIPFSYMSPTDRYVAFSGLLFNDLDPTPTPSRLALIRLEDLSPESIPANLDSFTSWLKSENIPFTMAVIPQYLDPNGVFNNGVPVSLSLTQAPAMVSAIKEGIANGGTLDQIGYTHQYSNIDNPYNGVTGADYEFYRGQCATTENPPYTFVAPCSTDSSDYVIQTGPVPGDSEEWALGRVETGRELFAEAGLPEPTIWTTPHYAASAADYDAFGEVYSVRYEDGMYFGGELLGGAIDYSHVMSQFFPYEVHDLYGQTIIPQDLDYYQSTPLNNTPVITAQDIVNEAELDTALPQSVASVFLHPDYDPLSALEAIVSGMQQEGYTFVSPQTFMADNG
jgi:uncharacterized protein YdaL